MQHGGEVWSVCALPDGRLFTGSYDKFARVFSDTTFRDGDLAGEKWLRPGVFLEKSLSHLSRVIRMSLTHCAQTRRRCDISLGPSVLTSQAHVGRLSPCLRFCDGSRAPLVTGARDSGSPDMCTGTAVRCLTLRSREEPGVRSHCVFQVLPDDCVEKLLASKLASLKNDVRGVIFADLPVRGVLFADGAVASGLRGARVGPMPGAQRFLSLDTSDLPLVLSAKQMFHRTHRCPPDVPPFSFLKTVTPMRKMTGKRCGPTARHVSGTHRVDPDLHILFTE